MLVFEYGSSMGWQPCAVDAAGGLKVPFESGIAVPGGVGGCEEVGAVRVGGGDVMGRQRVEPCTVG